MSVHDQVHICTACVLMVCNLKLLGSNVPEKGPSCPEAVRVRAAVCV